ncbi:MULTISPECIES: hypothetical protein [Haloferax]|uniref:Uncharacterized protein n=2 Tax=Haloferax TaxID=2251 RepID=A0A6G1Z2T1_9EURY|nr:MULTISPECIES: hypothetical protein [Haloferax]KAB1189252.1 hypothetical protein Hfx1149_09505 [Haloferax sp. CBA1149]MRW80937.1 hypothetical protein [Haloferax marinisediminis]
MQDAALSKALVDVDGEGQSGSDTQSRQSFALAGALETARRESATATFDSGGITLAASLAFISTVFADRRLRDSLRSPVRATDDSAWYPSGVPARVDDELVVTGATLAVERFDVSVERVSTLCDIDAEKITSAE